MKKLADKKIFAKPLVVSILIIFLFFLGVFLAWQWHCWHKIIPDVHVAGIKLTGLNKNQAADKLSKAVVEKTAAGILKLVYKQAAFDIPLEQIALDYNITDSVENAYMVGHDRQFVSNWQERFAAFKKGVFLPIAFDLDGQALNSHLASISAQLFVPPIEPEIKIENGLIQTVQGKEGQELNLRQTQEKIIASISNFSLDENILLVVEKKDPRVSDDQLAKTAQRAKNLLARSLNLKTDSLVNTLDGEEIIQFLSFSNHFEETAVKEFIQNSADSFDKEPQNAAFQFENNRVTVFRPSLDGRKIDQPQAIALVLESLSQLEQSSQSALTYNLPVIYAPPEVKTSDVNDLGIIKLLGRGESYFRGSIASRIHNLTLASSQLNGLLIKPEEVFSFNGALGDVSSSTGYQPAYIIKEGRTILGDGGGVCQVSTTLFRAALNAGLPIEERRAHAYRVSYYEQKSQVGQDATVYAPSTDLKIKNDTPAHVLIQSRVDQNNVYLAFELYGTADGRTVGLSKTRLWDQIPPPPDLYQDDPTLPAGTVKQIDWNAWGAKAAFDWQVTRAGEVLQERTFYSNYRPWQAIFLRGTKTD